MSASKMPPKGLAPRQLDQAQTHADSMQTLKNIKIQQELQKEDATNRIELAKMGLEASMIENQESLIMQYPFEYLSELRSFNFPQGEAPQESIDISDQQPAESIEAGTPQQTERPEENKKEL